MDFHGDLYVIAAGLAGAAGDTWPDHGVMPPVSWSALIVSLGCRPAGWVASLPVRALATPAFDKKYGREPTPRAHER